MTNTSVTAAHYRPGESTRGGPLLARVLVLLPLLLVGCRLPATMIRTLEDGPRDENQFKVAVVHCAGRIDSRKTDQEARCLTEENWSRVEPLIRRAAELGAKLVVTPEYGITGGGISKQENPVVGCRLPATPTKQPLYKMGTDMGADVLAYVDRASRVADELDIFLVVQAIEEAEIDGKMKYFNSQLAFDADGRLVANYRKINLYLTEMATRDAGAETCCFDTPWGRFGMLVCSDAAVPWTVGNCIRKHNVDFFVCSSRWQPYLPLTGNMLMNITAAFSGKTILWSNHHNTAGTSGGAGIIRPGAGNDTAIPNLGEPGVVIANLPLPDRVARLPVR